jgi:Zn-finger protein
MMLQMLDVLRNFSPDMTIGKFIAHVERLVTHDECLHCHQPISALESYRGNPVWVHDNPGRMRGCRAASFRVGREEGWDESLSKVWKATPKDE